LRFIIKNVPFSAPYGGIAGAGFGVAAYGAVRGTQWLVTHVSTSALATARQFAFVSRTEAFNNLTYLRGLTDRIAQRGLDFAVKKAIQKGYVLADNAAVGRLVDRYTGLAAKMLDKQLQAVGSRYRLVPQFARTARGVNIVDGSRPRRSGILDLAITDTQYNTVYSGWDTTVSARWNSAADNAKYLRLFNIEEGVVRELNPSIRRY